MFMMILDNTYEDQRDFYVNLVWNDLIKSEKLYLT